MLVKRDVNQKIKLILLIYINCAVLWYSGNTITKGIYRPFNATHYLSRYETESN